MRRVCRMCEVEKDISAFHSCGITEGGKHRWRLDCKKCWNAAHNSKKKKANEQMIELSGTAALATKHWVQMGEWMVGDRDARPDG